MWHIQLALLLFIVCRMFRSSFILRLRWMDNIKMDFQQVEGGRHGLDCCGLRWGQVAGSCGCSNDLILPGISWQTEDLLASQECLYSMLLPIPVKSTLRSYPVCTCKGLKSATNTAGRSKVTRFPHHWCWWFWSSGMLCRVAWINCCTWQWEHMLVHKELTGEDEVCKSDVLLWCIRQ
jgi:hypothetical protein